MSRTKTITLFTFDELSDTAKEKARNWWRVGEAIDGADSYTIEDAAQVAELLGINLRTHPIKLANGETRYEPSIWWSGFSSQGDGACFEGSYRYRAGSVVSIKDHAPNDAKLHEIAEGLAQLQYAHQNAIRATVKHIDHHYYHENTTEIEVFNDLDPDAITADTEDAVRELLRDFMRWIYRQLEADYDYRMSDENVDDSIQANRYEFTEDGAFAG
jgi:hypothetical protein